MLTELGWETYGYAKEIFILGQRLTNTLKARESFQPVRLIVGITGVVPKMVAYTLLKGTFMQYQPIKVVCWEGRLKALLGEHIVHTLDIV